MQTPEAKHDDRATAAAPAADPSKNPNEEVINLDTPIIRGEQKIDQVTLRKPMSGELRGMTLSDLAQMDVLALRKVLPRISTPSLTDIEVGRMDPADLFQCGLAIAGFLLQRSAKEAVLVA
ncbi:MULTISPECIES: phage tail assembly protein [Pseudomonas]|uniref:phage tail assembly protein n=1 Tax=Pseudomonas TaxID=286 RepID=UPI0015A37EBE|nr:MULTISPECIES: phage tail assembly protein [Pseudomonas]MBI6601655.1 phage tail assembly protein [Pseudomonas sp. S4_EA_1b]NVZ43724.1 phage tail assembly protein [Pseudomonas tolaasii]NWA49374.1 phage tail assembly protein [Pseudomonas tolaasii]